MDSEQNNETELVRVFGTLASAARGLGKSLTNRDKMLITGIRVEPTTLKILPRGTLVSYPHGTDLRGATTVRKEVATRAVQNALQELKNNASFRETLEVYSRAGFDPIAAQMIVGTFVQEALQDDANVETLVNLALDEVLHRPVQWNMTLYLLGVGLSEDEIRLSDYIVRKPRPSDFSREVFLILDHKRRQVQGWPIGPETLFPYDTIVEWKLEGVPRGYDHEDKVVEETRRLVMELRLLKSGRYLVTGWNASTPTLGLVGKFHEYHEPQTEILLSPSLYYTAFDNRTQLDSADAERYSRLQVTAFSRLHAGNRLSNRAARAAWVLNEMTVRNPAEALLFAVIGLESLFLEDESELRLKLAIRTAAMLQHVGEDPAKVYDDVWEAYGIRNKLVHGNIAAGSLWLEAQSLETRMREYLRKATLCWLQMELMPKGKGSETLVKLEKSFSHANERKMMKRALRNVET